MLRSSSKCFTSAGSFPSRFSSCRCVVSNISSALRLNRSISFTDSGTSSNSPINSVKYFFPCSCCLLYSAPASISSPLILFFICTACPTTVFRYRSNRRSSRILHRSHVAGRQQIAPHQVGDLARIQSVALLLGRADGLHHGRIPHLQLGRKRLQRIVNPAAEQRGFHRPTPGLLALPGPLPQHVQSLAAL